MSDFSNAFDLDITQFEYEQNNALKAEAATKLPVLDASDPVDDAMDCLKANGVTTIIRYYCRDPKGSWKTIKKPEADKLIGNKFSLAIVHEVGSTPDLFSYASGKLDAEYAIRYGRQTIGQPLNSAIYFAVDFDALHATQQQRIIPYFNGVRDAMVENHSPYKIGVYGSGLTCQTILDQGLAEFVWLAQSRGWTGFSEFKSSKKWNLLQRMPSDFCGLGIDFDDTQPDRDFGAFSTLDRITAPFARVAPNASDMLTTSSILDGVNADLKSRVILLVQECLKKGVKMVPCSGVRTPMEQAKLWRQSRDAAQIGAAVQHLKSESAPFLAGLLESAQVPAGPHVTNALPGMSWHQWGEAVDCYWEVNGQPEWNDDAIHGGVQGYHVYADTAESPSIGLTAGGHWTSFKDWPHVQL